MAQVIPFAELMKAQKALLDDFVVEAVAQLRAQGSYVTGDLARSIKPLGVTYNGDEGLTLEYEYLKYGDYVETGAARGAGKEPPFEDIKQWITLKSIPVPSGITVDQFAWAIVKKIGKKGNKSVYHKPKPFIDIAWNNAIDNQINNIAQAMANDLAAETVRQMDNAGLNATLV